MKKNIYIYTHTHIYKKLHHFVAEKKLNILQINYTLIKFFEKEIHPKTRSRR